MPNNDVESRPSGVSARHTGRLRPTGLHQHTWIRLLKSRRLRQSGQICAQRSKASPSHQIKINQTNAIARRTAIKLLALCCPGQMPESSLLTQVPALETQYRNAEKTLKFFPIGGGGDLGSDSSDSGDASDESDDSTTQESNAYLDGSEEACPIFGGG